MAKGNVPSRGYSVYGDGPHSANGESPLSRLDLMQRIRLAVFNDVHALCSGLLVVPLDDGSAWFSCDSCLDFRIVERG